jgi:hypothetical protein
MTRPAIVRGGTEVNGLHIQQTLKDQFLAGECVLQMPPRPRGCFDAGASAGHKVGPPAVNIGTGRCLETPGHVKASHRPEPPATIWPADGAVRVGRSFVACLFDPGLND